jgi:FkbM family methyltransferase
MKSRMTSYSANFEDVLLDRAFRAKSSGFYIDVGAYEPVDDSVTNHFYANGWRGINIEPNPAPFKRLARARDRDVNLNIGISDHDGTLTVYEAPSACWSVDPDILTGWFGADRDDLVERSIPVATLANVCERYVPRNVDIDFLKIDVEGHEAEVVAGADWSRWRPTVVLIENNKPESWEPQLLQADYLFAFFDGLNRFYLRAEDRQLLPVLAVPANVADAFLIHRYDKRISELEHALGQLEGVGLNAISLAIKCHRAAKKHPRLASALRPLIRRMAR